VNRSLTIAVTAVAGFVLVACGPAASGNSSGASSAASEAAASAGDVAEPSFSEGAVPDLEAMIPDKVGELTIQKTSAKGDKFLTSADSDPAVAKFVSDLGVKPSDISIAVGTGFSTDARVVIFALRAAGASTDRLISGFKEATTQSPAPFSWTSTDVGGKQVETATDGASTTYLFAKGDVLFWVNGDAASAEEAVSGLP
jgi:hypothetical protein